jgi:hypothetical protein
MKYIPILIGIICGTAMCYSAPKKSLSEELNDIFKTYQDIIIEQHKSHRKEVFILTNAVIQLIERSGNKSIELDEEPSLVGPPYPVPNKDKDGFWHDLGSGVNFQIITVTQPKDGKRIWKVGY